MAARAVLNQHGDERLYRSLLELLAAPTSARRSWSSTRTNWPSRSTSGRCGQHYLSVLRRPRPPARYRLTGSQKRGVASTRVVCDGLGDERAWDVKAATA